MNDNDNFFLLFLFILVQAVVIANDSINCDDDDDVLIKLNFFPVAYSIRLARGFCLALAAGLKKTYEIMLELEESQIMIRQAERASMRCDGHRTFTRFQWATELEHNSIYYISCCCGR